MITLTLTFENKNKKKDGTTITSQFTDIQEIRNWLDKVEPLSEKEIKIPIGFILKGDKKCQ